MIKANLKTKLHLCQFWTLQASSRLCVSDKIYRTSVQRKGLSISTVSTVHVKFNTYIKFFLFFFFLLLACSDILSWSVFTTAGWFAVRFKSQMVRFTLGKYQSSQHRTWKDSANKTLMTVIVCSSWCANTKVVRRTLQRGLYVTRTLETGIFPFPRSCVALWRTRVLSRVDPTTLSPIDRQRRHQHTHQEPAWTEWVQKLDR